MSEESTLNAEVVSEEAGDESSGTTAVDTPAADTSTETAPPAADETAVSVIQVSGGPTGPWEINGRCSWTPDNTAPASFLYDVESLNSETEATVSVFEAWAFDVEENPDPFQIGTILEPAGNILFVIGIEPSYDGETMTLLVDTHEGLKAEGVPPDYTLTMTCTP